MEQPIFNDGAFSGNVPCHPGSLHGPSPEEVHGEGEVWNLLIFTISAAA
jgi:hypothetical protein